MKKDIVKVSYILNILIVILVVIASIVMFGRINFMHMPNPVEEEHIIGMMKYFTTDSNLFVGFASLLLVIEEYKVLKDSRKAISPAFYILKFIATVSVSITFLTVFLYLGPGSEGGIMSMLTNSNLFFHLIIPVLSIVSFVCFEKSNKIDKKYIKYGLIPTVLYTIFYMVNVLSHIENYKVSIKYDWYWFLQNGLWLIVIILPLMLVLTYFVSMVLYKLNYKRGNKA
ncbi:MAG: hypothetical protein IKX00_03865 [Bacilli bacterium]|nr:hypothetical protein [Bacilli bacterium]